MSSEYTEADFVDASACGPCPWLKPGQPDITPELRRLAEDGEWFACHGRGGGSCIGAILTRRHRHAVTQR